MDIPAEIERRETRLKAMRKGHPANRRKLALQDLARCPLVTVSVGGQEDGAVGGFILKRGQARQAEVFDRHALVGALTAIGARPRHRTTVTHSLSMPALLRGSDMLSTMPSSLARSLPVDDDLLMSEPP